jgi:hypothetical protein
VYRQAEEIFSIGREIMDTVKQRKTMFPVVSSVGHVLLIYLLIYLDKPTLLD